MVTFPRITDATCAISEASVNSLTVVRRRACSSVIPAP